jgi:hypothetical protein
LDENILQDDLIYFVVKLQVLLMYFVVLHTGVSVEGQGLKQVCIGHKRNVLAVWRDLIQQSFDYSYCLIDDVLNKRVKEFLQEFNVESERLQDHCDFDDASLNDLIIIDKLFEAIQLSMQLITDKVLHYHDI